MKKIIFLFLLPAFTSFNIDDTGITIGLPDDLDKETIVLSQPTIVYMWHKNSDYMPDVKKRIDKQWGKCVAVMKEYPFKNVIVDAKFTEKTAPKFGTVYEMTEGEVPKDAKYSFHIIPLFTNKDWTQNTHMLVIKDNTVPGNENPKIYSLRKQNPNSVQTNSYGYPIIGDPWDQLKKYIKEAKKKFEKK